MNSPDPAAENTAPRAACASNDACARLQAFAFPPQLLAILRTLGDAGFEAYVVGGSVRDILLGRAPQDFDVATSARAEQVTRLFRRVVPTGLKHGTVLVLKGGFKTEVTTFRGEGDYLDGRHPESVVFLDEVQGDLARRDFTINAMAYDPVRRRFVDPFGGQVDLDKRVVRCVGTALERFSEDGLRPLRAVRFATALDFDIDPATMAAIAPTLSTFDKVSLERQRDEFVKLLASAHPARGLELLDQSRILPRLLPALAALGEAALREAIARLDRLIAHAPDADLALRLAALLSDLAPDDLMGRVETKSPAALLLRHLRLSNAEIDATLRLIARRGFARSTLETDADLRRALSCVGPDIARPLLSLAIAHGTPIDAAHALARRVDALLATRPPLSTADLALDGNRVGALLGQPKGPAIGRALKLLLDAVLEDPARNTPEALAEILRRHREDLS